VKQSFLIFSLFNICLNAHLATAQIAPDILWQKCYGGSSSDQGLTVDQTLDGGFIVSGATSSYDGDVSGNHGSDDFWVIRLNGIGDTLWTKSLGGSNYDADANSIHQTSDGGYFLAGTSLSNDGDVSGNHGIHDYWVVKLDSTGLVEWQRSLGGSNADIAFSSQQTEDGGYIVAGGASSTDGDVTGNHGNFDAWLVKLNPLGVVQWQKCLGGSQNDEAASIQQTSDHGFIVAGYSASNDGDVSNNHGGADYWIVKLDSAGIIQWQKSLGGTNSDQAFSIYQIKDGGYICAGGSWSDDGDVSSNHGGQDYWIVKLDASGNLDWQQSFGGSDYDIASTVFQTNDDGYIVSGSASSNDGDVIGNQGGFDCWILKLDTTGAIEWQKSLGGSGDDGGYAISNFILPLNDGGYIIVSNSNSNNGDVSGNHGGVDYWIVRLEGIATGLTASPQVSADDLHVFPNPATDEFKLMLRLKGLEKSRAQINISNLMGEAINERSGVVSNGFLEERIFIDKTQPSGMYLLKVTVGSRMWNQILIIER